MKLVFLTTWNDSCGIAGYSKNLISGLRSVDDYLEVEVRRIEKRLFKSIYSRNHDKYCAELCSGLSKGDVVHIQHEFSFFGDSIIVSNNNLLAILRDLSRKDVRVVITFHTMPPKSRFSELIFGCIGGALERVGALLEIRSWRRVARMIEKGRTVCLVHNFQSRAILMNAGLSEKYVHVIPAGVGDYFDAPINKADAKNSLGCLEGDFIIAMFGFVAEYKGVDIACEALQCLPQKFKLIVAGSTHPDNLKDRTFDKILRKYWGDERIKFLGFVSNEEMLLLKSAADIFLAPYREVGLASSAAINAGISSGVPVIASNIDAFVDINREEEVVSLICQEQSRVLALEILKLEKTPERRAQLISNSRIYASRNSWINVAKMHAEHYKL